MKRFVLNVTLDNILTLIHFDLYRYHLVRIEEEEEEDYPGKARMTVLVAFVGILNSCL